MITKGFKIRVISDKILKKNRSVSSQEIYIFVLCVYIVIIKPPVNLTLRFVLKNNIYFNKKVFFVALYSTITVQPAVLELDGSHKAENM